MRIFVDTANTASIREAVSLGFVSGVTTNPTIISRENRPFDQVVSEILTIDPSLTVLLEAVSETADDMVAEAQTLAKFGPNIVVKVPATAAGLRAVRILNGSGIETTVTLTFSVNQAIAAACAGATYVAPFVGRLDDIGTDGIQRVRDIHNVLSAQGSTTRIIAASIRSPGVVGKLFEAGADTVTVPVKVARAMMSHPLTDTGLARFNEDWRAVPTA
jgi:transaldolase